MSNNPQAYGRLIMGEETFLCPSCFDGQHWCVWTTNAGMFNFPPYGHIACGCEQCIAKVDE